MQQVRRSVDRPRTQLESLNSAHSFSYGSHYDPAHMGYGALRVLNEDRVDAGAGLDGGADRDMEVITYVTEGELKHSDDLGNGRTIKAGGLQRLTVGKGVKHLEQNASADHALKLLQIWIRPNQSGLAPEYQYGEFAKDNSSLRLIGSADGRAGSVLIHQDVNLYRGRISPEQSLSLPLVKGRRGWMQMVRGSAYIGDTRVSAGDGLALQRLPQPIIRGADLAELRRLHPDKLCDAAMHEQPIEFLFFDLA